VTKKDIRHPDLGGSAIETGFQVAFTLGANHLLGHSAILEDQKRGNGTDLKLRGKPLIVVNVDFANLDLALLFGGEFVQHGSDLLAGAAPFRPEIHQHWRGRLQGFFFKVVLGQRDDQRRGHNFSKIKSEISGA
jgi:hypothetical protein